MPAPNRIICLAPRNIVGPFAVKPKWTHVDLEMNANTVMKGGETPFKATTLHLTLAVVNDK